MVKLKNICHKYGDAQVLNNYSLEIGAGQRVCLFGPSGCGKTTVLKIISGLLAPESGTVNVSGNVSMVFQEDRLCPALTVLQNLTLVNDNREAALGVLQGLDIADKADDLPENLSGGQSRRVAIARALCKNADILILDEPFNGVDEKTVQTVVSRILAKYGDKTIIMVSHDKSHAGLLGATIINM